MPRTVTYAMGASLDGFIAGPDGRFDWSPPDEELFAFATDEVESLGVHLLGRKLYETMLFWEPDGQDRRLDDAQRRFAALWRALPKVVFSSTLSGVVGNARLATGTIAEEIERLREEPGGDIAIGGATLAASAADAGLIDEYRPRFHPVVVGGGTPFFPRADRPIGLRLLATRTFASGVTASRYGVGRSRDGDAGAAE